ncbi:short-subunit dehydrogenase [Actimicrobium sp. GrIS 1.19]|uniref:SDR family NAD(P)-dependent oxidoreductase n=1 Tax=Actimicrobium sp. GrIS 1.19 TaxID=3071708 RepID=UPI002E04AD1C|nr:short-subunit dehydrogenase [Actimicrobium sp. GrIS 1.19]
MSRASSAFRPRYGEWAVVTGASDGIGRAFACQLAAAGLNLVLVARRTALLHALADELTRAHGIACRVLVADLSDRRALHEMAEATIDLDVCLLVAAAGFGTSGPFIAASLAAESDMLEVNCAAVLALSWHYARRFATRGRGGLVLMSSLLAFHGVPRAANYAATKAYVQTLAEGLHAELAPLGVDVVASAPGPIRSGFAQRADMRMAMSQEPDVVARGTLAALGRRTTVRPGWLSKLLGWSLAPLPRWAKIMVIKKVMGDMTAHQSAPASVLKRPVH